MQYFTTTIPLLKPIKIRGVQIHDLRVTNKGHDFFELLNLSVEDRVLKLTGLTKKEFNHLCPKDQNALLGMSAGWNYGVAAFTSAVKKAGENSHVVPAILLEECVLGLDLAAFAPGKTGAKNIKAFCARVRRQLKSLIEAQQTIALSAVK